MEGAAIIRGVEGGGYLAEGHGGWGLNEVSLEEYIIS